MYDGVVLEVKPESKKNQAEMKPPEKRGLPTNEVRSFYHSSITVSVNVLTPSLPPALAHHPTLPSNSYRWSKMTTEMTVCGSGNGSKRCHFVAPQSLQNSIEKYVFPVYGPSWEASFRMICPIECILNNLFKFPPCFCHDFAEK